MPVGEGRGGGVRGCMPARMYYLIMFFVWMMKKVSVMGHSQDMDGGDLTHFTIQTPYFYISVSHVHFLLPKAAGC